MKNFASVSPLKILEQSTAQKSLGAGNIGVLIAKAGVGKTACLIHMALHKLFEGEPMVHVAVGDTPEKINAYYRVIFSDLAKAIEEYDIDDCLLKIDRGKVVLSYMDDNFDPARLNRNLRNLKESLSFSPKFIIIDGIDFTSAQRELFIEIKKLAEEFNSEIWLTALINRHMTAEVNNNGIPYPCSHSHVDDIFNIIIHMHPEKNGLFLSLLKDHSGYISKDIKVRLDPTTFLLAQE